METKQFAIHYRLTLKDDSYLETTTYVAANNGDIALNKLKIWIGERKLEFSNIEVFDIRRVFDVII